MDCCLKLFCQWVEFSFITDGLRRYDSDFVTFYYLVCMTLPLITRLIVLKQLGCPKMALKHVSID